jgi:hypothetical protein
MHGVSLLRNCHQKEELSCDQTSWPFVLPLQLNLEYIVLKILPSNGLPEEVFLFLSTTTTLSDSGLKD